MNMDFNKTKQTLIQILAEQIKQCIKYQHNEYIQEWHMLEKQTQAEYASTMLGAEHCSRHPCPSVEYVYTP